MSPDREPDDDPRLARALREYEEALLAGRLLDRAEILTQLPGQAAELAEGLDALDFLHAARQPDTPPPLPGAASLPPHTLGDYRIVREVGRGGMGVVFEAVQLSLGRRVALKILPTRAAGDPAYLERFRREAKAAARLHHTNIVPVFGVGEHQGLHFFAMQFIDGTSLDAVLRERRRGLGLGAAAVPTPPAETTPPNEKADGAAPAAPTPLPRLAACPEGEYHRRVAGLALQVAEALDYAHRQGVVHRDVKPANLLLDEGGTVWVSDFGLAQVLDAGNLTDTGEVVGTLRYLPPERLRGRGDARSEVYSLGVTLYEILTLRPAFEGEDRVRLIEQIAERTPPPLRRVVSNLPRDLETIVLKAVDREPAHRYPTAGEMAEDLRRFLEDRPIRARPLGWPGRLVRWARRKPLVATLLSGLLLALACLLGLGGWSYASIHRALDDKGWALQEKEEQRLAAQAAAEGEGKARRKAEAETYEAILSKTRLLRLAHPPGWRREALDNLQRLTRMQTPLRDQDVLRKEAVACILAMDVTQMLALPEPHPSGVLRSLDFSPDGKALAGASSHGVFVWEIGTGRLKRALTDPDHAYWRRGARLPSRAWPAVRFAPDGKAVASVGSGNRVLFDGWAKGKPRIPQLLSTVPARHLAFDRPGGRLAVGRADLTVRVYNPATGGLVREVRAAVANARANDFRLPVALSPDGKLLAVPGPGHSVQVHELEDKEAGAVNASEHEQPVRALVFSPDGTLLASAGDRAVHLWDVRRRRQRLILYTVHRSVSGLAFSPDGRLLAVSGEARGLRLWDTVTGQPVFTLAEPSPPIGATTSVAFGPGDQIAYTYTRTAVYRATGRQERRQLHGHGSWTTCAAAHPHKPLLVSGGLDGSLILWDLETGLPLRHWQARGADPIAALAFSPDGSRLACAIGRQAGQKADHAAQLWELKTGKLLATLRADPQRSVDALAFHPSGTLLAGTLASGEMALWDTKTGNLLQRVPGSRLGPAFDLAFLHNGTRLLTAHSNGLVLVRDAEDRTVLHSARVGPRPTGWMAVRPDERQVGLLTQTGTLVVLSLPDLKEVAARPGIHPPTVGRPAFSPDGQWFASCGSDGQAIVYDAHTLQKVLTLPKQSFSLTHCLFTPDGRYLITRGKDTGPTVYDLPLIRAQLAEIGLDWGDPQKT